MSEKISLKKKILIVIIGMVMVTVFRFAIGLALNWRYGFDFNFYSYLGRLQINLTTITLIIFSALLGGIFIGAIVKRKAWLYNGFVGIVSFIIVLLMMAYIWFFKGFTESGVQWAREGIIDSGILAILYLIPLVLGGIIGESIGKITEEGSEEDRKLFGFYFSLSWRLLFIIPFIAICIYLFTYLVGNIALLLKWATIGAIFILIHPSQWFFWLLLPIWEFLFWLLWAAMMVPLFAPYFLFKIFDRYKARVKQAVLVISLVIGLFLGTGLLDMLGHYPVFWTVGSITSRGKEVWPILLDKYTAPLAYENLVLHYEGKNEKEKIEKFKLKAANSFYKLGLFEIKKGQYDMAVEELRHALEFKPDDFKIHYDLGRAYYMQGFYEEAINEYSNILNSQPDNLGASCNLALAFEVKFSIEEDEDLPEEISDEYTAGFVEEIEKSTELWNTCLELAKTKSVDDEIISIIESYNNGELETLPLAIELYFLKMPLY